jgi:cytochrome c peroxidase
MRGVRASLFLIALGAAISLSMTAAESSDSTDDPSVLTPIEQLGQFLFFDENLSTPPGQSCAACHAPEVGFTGPDSAINAAHAVYPGAVHTRFGNRKPPTAAYGGESPVLFYDAAEDVFVGGMFWDGRATGWTLGDPLAEQAQGPFLAALEQNNPNPKVVCIKVAKSDYADLYEEVFGEPVNIHDVETTYVNIALAIAAFERSEAVNPFTSKYDYYLAGMVDLTPEELLGLQLFDDPDKGNCAACHPSQPGPGGEAPLFTDFTYDNLGVPRNPNNPFYGMPRKWNPMGAAWLDPGLGGFLETVPDLAHLADDNLGKHKVPTLRNVDLRPSPDFVKAFAHNGFFTTLEDIVHFYNTRDVEPWPEPEIPQNVNTEELGDLGLTAAEEQAIVAFLKTLSDGFVLP